MDRSVDLFVIGAGSGGVRAARIASGYGARVMVAEEYRVGGTCVIRGCVPKKLLVYAARFSDEFEDAAGYGWTSFAGERGSYSGFRFFERLERVYAGGRAAHASERSERATRSERAGAAASESACRGSGGEAPGLIK